MLIPTKRTKVNNTSAEHINQSIKNCSWSIVENDSNLRIVIPHKLNEPHMSQQFGIFFRCSNYNACAPQIFGGLNANSIQLLRISATSERRSHHQSPQISNRKEQWFAASLSIILENLDVAVIIGTGMICQPCTGNILTRFRRRAI